MSKMSEVNFKILIAGKVRGRKTKWGVGRRGRGKKPREKRRYRRGEQEETDMNHNSHLSNICSRITPEAFLLIHLNVYDQEWTTLM